MMYKTEAFDCTVRPPGTGFLGLALHISLLTVLTLLCLHGFLGLSLPGIADLLPWIFAGLPLLTLLIPRSLPHVLILFLPLQQILLCIAYTWNPDWGPAMKWILGWKDACLLSGLAAAAYLLRGVFGADRNGNMRFFSIQLL